ncbi:hypothetical protein K443DRAFT_4565 [Laccaria amethystina LaAM-08-1]|uniref:Uncharacterized protein n=1 Tax=Laccaria amethystina LaAM-08-1 TaxID=1095629 RepID=A0A0C9Y9A8_9AGAR|nr:hypothetical protein K443DRAFT_4565 [Laccaria amethystina LaAM-08-1]
MLRRLKTRFHHRVEHLSDAQITLDTTYLHSVRVAGEFFSIILAMKSVINNSNSLLVSRDGFSPPKGCIT